ncbi:FxSxx-COOH cyclophane-containing RiPP peptide [Nonomuraea sp. NPDC050202]|jgi:FXSXX-COOH protein|uniref:FxSxx-COOH cyclophane-containing RiPP peptide n=1 Tax=Nonomuraea sp. NPDC050202 TaxID=3155035 RepID=UPI0033C4CA10
MSSVDGEYGGWLLDVSGWNLRDLDALPSSPLTQALRRLVDEAGSGPVAGFQSAL